MKRKPVATVLLPVAEFRDRVRDYDGDDSGLARWIRVFSLSLSRCADASDSFAISLIEDVDDFKAKRASNIKTWRNNKRDEAIVELKKEGFTRPTRKQIADKISDMREDFYSSGTEVGGGENQQDADGIENAPAAGYFDEPKSAERVTAANGQDARTSIPTVDEMYAYVRSKGLDDILAREWYDMTTERGWTDRDGCPVHAWKKMIVGYVRQRAANLASKNETA